MSRSLLATALLGLLVAAPAWAQDGFESHYFDSDGVRLHYIDEGTGEPVLLIHGLAVSLAMNWAEPGIVQKLVDAGYRVVAYDARGHGRSEKLHDPALYGQVEVEDAVRLLDHLGVDRAHVVGYSRGGAVASRLRARRPERVLTLTLGGHGRDLGGDPPAEAPAMAELGDSLAEGRLGPLLRFLNPESPADEIRALGRRIAEANDMRAVAAAFRGVGRFAPLAPADLATGEVPALAVAGERDVLLPAIRQMAAAVEGMETLVIPGATHVTAFARPEFTTALLGFFAKHGARRHDRHQ